MAAEPDFDPAGFQPGRPFHTRQPGVRRIKENEVETMLKFRCDGCDKEFIVTDHQVDSDTLTCPHCQEEVEVPELDYEG